MAAMSLFTVACVEEEPVPYEPGQPDVEGCYGVYFPVQESNFVVDPSDDPVQTITVARSKTQGGITVPVTIKTSVEGVLEVSPIVFEDGQSETTITVSYPTAEVGTKYTMSLTIEDPQYASKYLDFPVSLDFSVLREKWVSLGTAKFNDDWRGIYVETEILQNDLVRSKFRIMDPYGPYWESKGYTPKDAPAEFFEIEILQIDQVLWPGEDYETKIEIKDLIYYKPICTGYYDATNGGTHYYYHPCNFSATEAQENWVYNRVVGYQENGLPTAFQIAPFPYMPGVGGWNYSTEPLVTIVFPGAVLVDYSFDMAVDYTVEGVTPVNFEMGVDINSVNYVVAAGELGYAAMNELLAAVAAGTAENLETITAEDMILDEEEAVKYASLEIECPSTGKYTIVAVGLDADGNAQASQTAVFDYVAADDDDFDVEYVVEVNDTPARYADLGYNATNSFSFLVYGGNDLVDAKVNLYTTADVEKYGLDAIVADLRTETSKVNHSVSEAELELVNSVTGYGDVITGLKDNTSYTLVVWATNGIQTKVETVVYKTEKNPEVFKSLGMAQYTDDLVSYMFGLDPVTYEVEVEESQDNPGKYRLVNPYGAAYPYNEAGDYDAENDYYLVIDATDPDYVNIYPGELGADWGYGMMSVMSMADYFIAYQGATVEIMKELGYYGTLKDGVISFTAGTAGLIMGQYLADGGFEVVLPGAAKDESSDEVAGDSVATSSVNRSVVNSSDYELPMFVGRFAGLEIDRDVKTVNCEVSVIANPVRKTVERNFSSALKLR